MAEPPFGCEPSGIAVRRILSIGALLAVAVVLTVITVRRVLEHRLEPARAQSAHAAPIPPAPRLQAHPQNDLAALRVEKRTLLEGWGWSDGTRQFARIPIEEAMALYVRQHAATEGSAASISAPEPERGP